MACWYRMVCAGSNPTCERNCIRYMEMNYLLENSGLSKSQQVPVVIRPSRIDDEAYGFLNEILEDIVKFVQNGESLIIWSKNTGNGKTTWARKLLTRYFHEIAIGNAFRVRGQFVSFTDFRMRCKDFDDPNLSAYKKLLEEVDLVVWDDLADTALTDHEYKTFMQILENRLTAYRANIYTTNLVEDQLQVNIGRRLYSRIANPSHQIVFRDSDKRGIF